METLFQVFDKSNLVLGYIFIMFLSGFSFVYLINKWSMVPLKFFLIHFFIVTWSGLMYFNIFFHTFLSRYAFYCDWIVSTPLIVSALALSAMAKSKINWHIILTLIGLQAITIITGVLAQPESFYAKYTFFTLGCIAMLGMFYILIVPLANIAKSAGSLVLEKYKILASFVVLFWILYPIVWVLGTPGQAIISDYSTTLLFIVLPILCKSGFGFLDLYLLNKIYEHSSDTQKK